MTPNIVKSINNVFTISIIFLGRNSPNPNCYISNIIIDTKAATKDLFLNLALKSIFI